MDSKKVWFVVENEEEMKQFGEFVEKTDMKTFDKLVYYQKQLKNILRLDDIKIMKIGDGPDSRVELLGDYYINNNKLSVRNFRGIVEFDKKDFKKFIKKLFEIAKKKGLINPPFTLYYKENSPLFIEVEYNYIYGVIAPIMNDSLIS
jgi:hypothetical protein